jgi:hypothetical protein
MVKSSIGAVDVDAAEGATEGARGGTTELSKR